MLLTGGPRILDTSRSNSSIFVAYGAVVAAQSGVSLILIYSERACSARQLDIGIKPLFCAIYPANCWSNCVGIANVCRIRTYARKTESVEILVSLLGQSLPANRERANGVGVDTPCAQVSTREIVVIVPALLEL